MIKGMWQVELHKMQMTQIDEACITGQIWIALVMYKHYYMQLCKPVKSAIKGLDIDAICMMWQGGFDQCSYSKKFNY